MFHIYFYIFTIKGLSPDLQSFEQIRQIQRPTDVPDYGEKHDLEIRPAEKPTWWYSGVLHDLLWSDPDETIERWDENDVSTSRRFGAEIVYEVNNRIYIAGLLLIDTLGYFSF